MRIIDKIISESIDLVLRENNFKSKRARMMAAAHAAEREGDKGAVERTKNLLAKRAATGDINKERAERRTPYKTYEHIPLKIDNSLENNSMKREDYQNLLRSRINDADDYFNGENEFNGPVNFEDAEKWIRYRRENNDFQDDEEL